MQKYILLLLVAGWNIAYSSTNLIELNITGKQAQSLYHFLQAPEDGAAGHIYKQGKNVLCERVNADIDDKQGKLIPAEDPRRYSCKLQLNAAGEAQ